MLAKCSTSLIAFCCLAALSFAAAPDTDAILGSGKLDEGIATLQEHLKQQPKDDNARFGLGAVQFVQSVRRLGEKIAAFGPQANGNAELERLFGHLPAPAEPLTYPKLRQFTQEWINDLTEV